MTITRDNYEPFFLDFLEGKLEEDQIDQFLIFLEQNPDLKEELQLFDNTSLPEESIVFEGKQSLYKTEADEKIVLSNKIVDYLEGNLSSYEKLRFETNLANHPELEKEYKLFVNSRLKPDLSIEFLNKKKLYRKPRQVVIMNWVAGVAAIALLFLILNSVIQSGDKPDSTQVTTGLAELKPAAKPIIEEPTAAKIIGKTSLPKATIEKHISTPKASLGNKIIQPPTEVIPEKQATKPVLAGLRDSVAIKAIEPIFARLESEPAESKLAVSRSINVEKINESPRVINLEEFLASRAKKASKDGLLSAQRIIRTGLNVAAELSGNRISYQTKDGRISSLEFDSKLMAFSIPLDKKN